MKKPTCGCFVQWPEKAEAVVISAAVTIGEMIGPVMNTHRLCRDSFRYTYVTMVALMAREFAEADLSHEPATAAMSKDEYFAAAEARALEFASEMAEEVVRRMGEVSERIKQLAAEQERDDAGGLQ